MQNLNTTNKRRDRGTPTRLISLLLFIALLVQTLSVCCFAVTGGEPLFDNSSSGSGGIINNLGKFDSDETIARLKKDLIASINKDLLKKVEDYELRGEVSAIITFFIRTRFSILWEKSTNVLVGPSSGTAIRASCAVMPS